jgi:muramoyltetrapeptide carboxypeptidase
MNRMEDTKIAWAESIAETIAGITGEYDYPLFFDFPAGHIADNRALYIGRKASITVHGKKAVLEYL